MDVSSGVGLDLTAFCSHCLARKPWKGVRGTITNPAEIVGKDRAGNLFLFFHPGKRPGNSAIRAAVSGSRTVSISHDPATVGLGAVAGAGDSVTRRLRNQEETNWVELLCDGLTFDLTGLDGGSGAKSPETHVNCTGDLANSQQTIEAIRLAPGPHLAGGQNSLPVVRSMMALAVSLAEACQDLVGFLWEPAGRFAKSAAFTTAIDDWLAGSAFPVPWLISVDMRADGAMQSCGLAFFTGQELAIEANLAAEPDTAIRLAQRLISQLVLQGRIERSDRIIGPDGNPLRLDLSDNRNLVNVRRG